MQLLESILKEGASETLEKTTKHDDVIRSAT